jgi:hypothetical protein
MLRARILEAEKQPLLANGSETTFVSWQRLGIQVPAATDTHATIDVLLKTVFSTRSVERSYTEEAGSNTSTVALRVVGGDEKRSLESETENMVTSATGLGPENDCPGEGQQQTRPVVRESAPHEQTRNCLTVTKIWS